jgi:hypothetical protein
MSESATITVMKQLSIFDATEVQIAILYNGSPLKNMTCKVDQADANVTLLFKWIIGDCLNKIEAGVVMPSHIASQGFEAARKAFAALRTPYLMVELEQWCQAHLEAIRNFVSAPYPKAIQALNLLKAVQHCLVELHAQIPA